MNHFSQVKNCFLTFMLLNFTLYICSVHLNELFFMSFKPWCFSDFFHSIEWLHQDKSEKIIDIWPSEYLEILNSFQVILPEIKTQPHLTEYWKLIQQLIIYLDGEESEIQYFSIWIFWIFRTNWEQKLTM